MSDFDSLSQNEVDEDRQQSQHKPSSARLESSGNKSPESPNKLQRTNSDGIFVLSSEKK